MKRRMFFLLTVMLLVFTSGCGGKKQDEEISDDDNVINWVTSGMVKIPQSHIYQLNRLLKEKGYDCSVNMHYYVEEYGLADEDSETIMEYIDTHDVDIMWCGEHYATSAPVYDLIENGMLEPLSPYLETEQGKKFMETYTENIWKASKYKGENYYIPNAGIGTLSEAYVGFNPDYVTAEEVSQFDGTVKSLKKMCDDKNKQLYLGSIILGEITGYTKCTWEGGVLISNDEKKAGAVYFEQLYEDTKTLNEMYNNNTLHIKNEYEDSVPTDKEAYFAWMTYGEPDKNNTDYTYLYGTDTITNLAGDSTAICSKSKKKELAFNLLVDILTDAELSNALLYGVEGRDYELVDGVAYPFLEDGGYGYIVDETGCYVNSYNSPGDDFSVSRAEKSRRCFEKLSESPCLGFVFDTSECMSGISKVSDAYIYNYMEIVKSKNFDGDWNEFIEVHKTPEAQAMYDEINRQLEEFFEGKD